MARARRGGLEWSQVRVGFVIILAIAVLALSVMSIGKMLNLFAKRYELTMLLPSAQGLSRGAPVTLAGQRVGQVQSIDFLPMGHKPGENNIVLRMEIAREAEPQIRADSRGTLRTQGLLGDRYVDISPGSVAAAALTPGDTLAYVPTPDLDQLIETAATTLDTAMVAINAVRVMTRNISEGHGTLGKLVNDDALYAQAVTATAQLRQTLARVNDPNGTLGRLMRDPAMYNRLVGAVTRVDSLAAMVAAGQGTLGRLIQSDGLYNQVLGVVGRADSTVTGLSALVGHASDGNGTIPRLLTDPTMYDQLLKAVVDLQTLVGDIRANPKRYRPEVNVDIF